MNGRRDPTRVSERERHIRDKQIAKLGHEAPCTFEELHDWNFRYGRRVVTRNPGDQDEDS